MYSFKMLAYLKLCVSSLKMYEYYLKNIYSDCHAKFEVASGFCFLSKT